MVYIKERNNRAKNVFGTSEKPRLSVHKTLSNIVAQVIDDEKGITLAYASTNDKDLKDFKCNVEGAGKVGEKVAKLAVKAGVSKIAFDRRNYRYHGKVKALADAARKAGLDF